MSTQTDPDTNLPMGAHRNPLELPHFPTRLQAVIWRNWSVVTPGRLAAILQTTEENIAASALAMGLGAPATPELEHLWLQRGYITLIRQNWHLLPYSQLLQLIGKSPEQMEYALKEDDFLWNKLGGFKPDATPVKWELLTPEQEQQTAKLRSIVTSTFGTIQPPTELPFEFLKHYGRLSASGQSADAPDPVQAERLRHAPLKLVYSYSAVYGDPLLDPELDPYPDGLLSDLADNGVNGIWLQGVLYTLTPWFGETAYSQGHAIRIANLNRLIERAARYGIGVYLYLNEPRGMPPEFFRDRPDWRGSLNSHTNLQAMCAATPEVLDALRDGVSDLFRKVPELAGVFTITMSENLTHCQSKAFSAQYPSCPRCANRQTYELVADINNAIAKGAHAAAPNADVIAWTWQWNPDWAANVLMNLNKDVTLMCTHEDYLQTETQGIRGRVGDYAMSKIGPGFHAEELWQFAKKLGLKRLAKIQMNNTWECSAVPYLPVPFLVKQNFRNLEARGISGVMAGWTLGGYPGGNLLLAEHEPEALADAQFGSAAPHVIRAWQLFGDAFAHFPLHGASMLYRGPQNYGPMNPLYGTPSGYHSTMVGFPYDDIISWRGILFPPDVFEEEFRILSEGWLAGVDILRKVSPTLTEIYRPAFEDLLRVAQAAGCHFRTTYLQLKFIRIRDAERTPDILQQMHAIVDEEIELAKTLLGIMRRDSRIGFEASNHYYYTEQSLREKILNCEQVRQVLDTEGTLK